MDRPRRSAAKRAVYAEVNNAEDDPVQTVTSPAKRQRRSKSTAQPKTTPAPTSVLQKRKRTPPKKSSQKPKSLLDNRDDSDTDAVVDGATYTDIPMHNTSHSLLNGHNDDSAEDSEEEILQDAEEMADEDAKSTSEEDDPVLPDPPADAPEEISLTRDLSEKVLLQRIAQLRNFYTNFDANDEESKEIYLHYSRWLATRPVRKWLFYHKSDQITTQMLKIVADIFRVYRPYSPFDYFDPNSSVSSSQDEDKEAAVMFNHEPIDKIHEDIFNFITMQMAHLTGKHFMRVKTSLKILSFTQAFKLVLDLPRQTAIQIFEQLLRRIYEGIKNTTDESLLTSLLGIAVLQDFPKSYQKILSSTRFLDLIFLHTLEKCRKFNPKAYEFTSEFLVLAESAKTISFSKCVEPYFKNMLILQEQMQTTVQPVANRRQSLTNPPSKLSSTVFQILEETFLIAPRVLADLFPVIETHFLVHDEDIIREKTTDFLANCYKADTERYNLIQEKPELWTAYLSRLKDKMPATRLIVVRSFGGILGLPTTDSKIVSEVIDGLNDRAFDPEENIRLAVICAISETVQARNNIFMLFESKSNSVHPFVEILCRQMLDKRPKVRTYSMYIGGLVYEALFHNINISPKCEAWAQYLGERLLRNYRRQNVSAEDKAIIERVLRRSLIGDYRITEQERLERLLFLMRNSTAMTRQIVLFLINSHGDYQRRFTQLFSMLQLETNAQNTSKAQAEVQSNNNNNKENETNQSATKEMSSMFNTSDSNLMAENFHNLSIAAQDKIVGRLIGEISRRTPPTSLIANEIKHGDALCDFLTILSTATQSKDLKVQESLTTVWRKIGDGAIPDAADGSSKRDVLLTISNPNLLTAQSQQAIENIQKLFDNDLSNTSHNRSKSFQSTSVSRPTLRQFDACLEHARPWLCDVKFMQLLVRKFKDESDNAAEEAVSDQESQAASQKSSRSKRSSIGSSANTSKSTLNSTITDEAALTNWQVLPEIIQQLFKSYQISEMDNFGRQFIAPIVQVFSEQISYTPALINLMRILLKSEPFREAGMEKSQSLLASSLQNLISECQTSKAPEITPKIIKQVTECWFKLAKDSDDVVDTYYHICEQVPSWTNHQLALVGVLSKNLPNEVERKMGQIWNRLKPVFDVDRESENAMESLSAEMLNTPTRGRRKGRRSASPKKKVQKKLQPIDTDHVRHALKCCVRCCESLNAPPAIVEEFYHTIINLTQCRFKELRIAAGTAILKLHALPKILKKMDPETERPVHLVPFPTSLKALCCLVADAESEVRRAIYKKMYVLFATGALPALFLCIFGFSSMEPEKSMQTDVKTHFYDSIMKMKAEHQRASDEVRKRGRFNVETSVLTTIYLLSVRPVYAESSSGDLDCLNDAKQCLELLLGLLLTRDDHTFGRLATAIALLKQCTYAENTDQDNEQVQQHLATICDVAIFCIQKISAKRHVNIPHIPNNLAGRLIPQTIFRKLRKRPENPQQIFLTDEFYSRYR